jgi:hypothetical protein
MKSGLKMVFNHLAHHFNTSEPETKRILNELACGLIVALKTHRKVELPKLGKLEIDSNDNLIFTPLDGFYSSLVEDSTPVPPERDVRIHVDNHRDVVRNSLFHYLRKDFPFELPWQHPNGTIFAYTQIRQQLTVLRHLDDLDYHALYARVLLGRRLDDSSYAFNCSQSALKRRCDLGLSSILTLLLHPELQTETIEKFYRIDN